MTTMQATLLESRALVNSAAIKLIACGCECSECECDGAVIETARPIVEEWHNVTHLGVFRFCDQQPCHAINMADRLR